MWATERLRNSNKFNLKLVFHTQLTNRISLWRFSDVRERRAVKTVTGNLARAQDTKETQALSLCIGSHYLQESIPSVYRPFHSPLPATSLVSGP